MPDRSGLPGAREGGGGEHGTGSGNPGGLEKSPSLHHC
jgi:hypothetical protein